MRSLARTITLPQAVALYVGAVVGAGGRFRRPPPPK